MRPSVVDPRAGILFITLHLGVCVSAAVLASGRAMAASVVIGLLSTLRYVCMALVAKNLGRPGPVLALAGMGWIAALFALAAAIFALGRAAKGVLPWAVAAALAGPAAATLAAFAGGVLALAGQKAGRLLGPTKGAIGPAAEVSA